MTLTTWHLVFLPLTLLSGAATAWLLWRGRRRRALAGALALALLCSGSLFMVVHPPATPPATPPFRLEALPQGRFQTIPPESLEQALQQARGRPVLLDFSASWCSSCQVWQKEVFSRSDVQAALAPFVLLRIDASDMTPATQDMLDRFGLAGLPALLSFDTRGQELGKLRILGEMPASRFIDELDHQILPAAQAGGAGRKAAFTKDSRTLSYS